MAFVRHEGDGRRWPLQTIRARTACAGEGGWYTISGGGGSGGCGDGGGGGGDVTLCRSTSYEWPVDAGRGSAIETAPVAVARLRLPEAVGRHPRSLRPMARLWAWRRRLEAGRDEGASPRVLTSFPRVPKPSSVPRCTRLRRAQRRKPKGETRSTRRREPGSNRPPGARAEEGRTS